MDARSAYLRSSARSWTQLDMVLALYRELDLTLNAGAALIEQGELALAARSRAVRLALALVDGLDYSAGELPMNIHRLVTHCVVLIRSDDPVNWKRASNIVQCLRSGYEQLQPELAAQA